MANVNSLLAGGLDASTVLAAVQRLKELSNYKGQMFDLFPDSGPLARKLYPKHLEFFRASAGYREICLQGSNGSGKTWGAGGYATALHATGLYPKWWDGCRFDCPIDAWVAGDTKETVRDITQAKLIGDVAKGGIDALGTGLLPRDLIVDYKFKQNTNYAADYVRVKHTSGGNSIIAFKSYDQRREAFQGTEKHWIWLDEEPPQEIYGECLMRGRTVGGKIALTYTPLKGYTDVVIGFQRAAKLNAEGASKALITCGWAHVPHLSEKEKAEMRASTPPHMRQAREFGIPSSGVGNVYTVDEAEFVVKPFPIPAYFRKVFGFDWGRFNTAVVWLAHDTDSDIVYAYADYKRGEVEIPVHASAIKAKGVWIPGVGDAAAINAKDGESILDAFKKEGVNLKLADKSVATGIEEVWKRLSSGRLKIFSTCQNTIEEYRTYRYDEQQKLVKENDHCMDALRYGIYSGLKIARPMREASSVTMQEQTFGIYGPS